MRTMILALVALFAMVPAWGQQTSSIYYSAPLSINSGYESGIPVDGKQVSDSVVQMSAPAFNFAAPGPRSEVSFTYQPEFRLYTTERQLNTWNHNAGARFSYRPSTRLTFDGGDIFYSTGDYSLLAQSLFLLPRGRYNENSLYLQAAYDLTPRNTVKIRFDSTFTTFDNVRLSPLFDHFTNGVTASLVHRLSTRHKVAANFSYLKSYRMNDHDANGVFLGPPGVPAKYAGLTYDLQASRTLLFELSSGFVRTNANSYTVSGAVEKRIRNLIISGGYSRYLSFFGGLSAPVIPAPTEVRFANAVSDTSVSETAGVHVRGELTKRFGMAFGLSGSRSITGVKGGDLKSYVNELRVDYKLTDHLVLFTSGQMYGQNTNALVGSPINRRRYFGGLEVVLFPTAEQVARHRDAQINPAPAAASSDDASGNPPAKAEDK